MLSKYCSKDCYLSSISYSPPPTAGNMAVQNKDYISQTSLQIRSGHMTKFCQWDVNKVSCGIFPLLLGTFFRESWPTHWAPFFPPSSICVWKVNVTPEALSWVMSTVAKPWEEWSRRSNGAGPWELCGAEPSWQSWIRLTVDIYMREK